jgi:hypothetical protein
MQVCLCHGVWQAPACVSHQPIAAARSGSGLWLVGHAGRGILLQKKNTMWKIDPEMNINTKTSMVTHKLTVTVELLYETQGTMEKKREQQSISYIVKQHL